MCVCVCVSYGPGELSGFQGKIASSFVVVE